jgi:hypothetical protein
MNDFEKMLPEQEIEPEKSWEDASESQEEKEIEEVIDILLQKYFMSVRLNEGEDLCGKKMNNSGGGLEDYSFNFSELFRDGMADSRGRGYFINEHESRYRQYKKEKGRPEFHDEAEDQDLKLLSFSLDNDEKLSFYLAPTEGKRSEFFLYLSYITTRRDVYGRRIPTYFVFCCPEEKKEKILEVIKRDSKKVLEKLFNKIDHNLVQIAPLPKNINLVSL